jgi:hypothetical protein
LCYLSRIVKAKELRKKRWVGDVAIVRNLREAYSTLREKENLEELYVDGRIMLK